jgi:L-lactate utilization protein LutC
VRSENEAMTTGREAFLQRVRQAVQAGNRPGGGALEPRGTVGYQGAGPDPGARFAAECRAAGGQVHLVPDHSTAAAKILEIVRAISARKALLGRGRCVDALNLGERLCSAAVEVVPVDGLTVPAGREPLFAADVGISGVAYLIAETGTVVVSTRPDEPRSLSLLPPVHIAVAERGQLLPDLFDLFAAFPAAGGEGGEVPRLPSCLTLITGPSKTGDIELRLVTGVHGPGEIHVVLMSGS